MAVSASWKERGKGGEVAVVEMLNECEYIDLPLKTKKKGRLIVKAHSDCSELNCSGGSTFFTLKLSLGKLIDGRVLRIKSDNL